MIKNVNRLPALITIVTIMLQQKVNDVDQSIADDADDNDNEAGSSLQSNIALEHLDLSWYLHTVTHWPHFYRAMHYSA